VTPDAFAKMGERYDEYGITIVFVSAFTPIPYKLFTISAGVFKIDFPNFVLASAVGRAARVFLVSMLLAWIGPKVRPLVDKYFNILTLAFVVLLVGGFVVAKLML